MPLKTSTPRFLNITEFRDYVQGLIDNDDDCIQREMDLMNIVPFINEEGKVEKAGYTNRMIYDYGWDWVKEGKIYLVFNMANDPFIITKHHHPEFSNYIWYLTPPSVGNAMQYNTWKGQAWVSWSKELTCDDTISFLNWLEESPFGVK